MATLSNPMSAFKTRLASFALFSLSVVGCETPASSSTKGEELDESGTAASSGSSTQSGQDESSSQGSTGGIESTADQSSSFSPSTTSITTTTPDLSGESSASSTTSSSSSSASSGSEPEKAFELKLQVPNHKVLLDDADGEFRLAITLMNQSAGAEALFDQAVQITDSGLIDLELPEPELAAGADPNKLQQFMVTLYQDLQRNGRPDEKDEFSATLLEFLVYKKSNPVESRWRKFDPETKNALLIEDPVPLVIVSNRSERKNLRLGGRVEKAAKDIRAVALLSEGEKKDLKRHFILGSRALDQEIDRDKIFWEGEISGDMNRRRWAEEKRPVLVGFGRHGITWFSGYNTPPPALIDGLRRNSKITDELCHEGQPLAAIWIEPSKSWVRTPSAAFLVAYHDLAPGWNIIKLERGGAKQLSFHSIPIAQRQELEFSPVCGKVSLPESGFEITPLQPVVLH